MSGKAVLAPRVCPDSESYGHSGKIYFDFMEGLCYNENSAYVMKTLYRMSGYYLLKLEREYL